MQFPDDAFERYSSSSPSAAVFASREYNHLSALLPEEVRQAANRGWRVFPVSKLAKLKGRPYLMIGEASSEISILEELAAAAHPVFEWRVAVGQSTLCILRLNGPLGRESFAGLVPDLDECLTLQASRGDTVWAFFRWPKGLVLRASAGRPAPGVSILGEGSCIIPPSGGCTWLNPWGEIEAVPYALRELAFETPDSSPGRTAPAPKPSPRPAPCRSTPQFP